MRNEEYVKNLEDIVKQMIIPLKKVPFSLIMEAISESEEELFDEKVLVGEEIEEESNG